MSRIRILVADNDPAIRRLIRANLDAHSYEMVIAMDGDEAIKTIEKEPPDLLIMEVMLPAVNSLEALRQLRKWSSIPVIMLSARQDEEYRIRYLDSGADDYITKPCRLEELLARIKNLLRRMEAAHPLPEQAAFYCGDLEIKFRERRVIVAKKEIKLTPTEYNLLQELALNAEKVLTHTILLHNVWGPEYSQEREYLRVFVGRLRKKLEPDPHKPNYIVTVPWVGYKLSGTAGNHLMDQERMASRYS
jgi:two-component system, OmpR family, KDP operon response regulator KdpE